MTTKKAAKKTAKRKQLAVYVTEKEYKQLLTAANGIPLAIYIRQSLFKGAPSSAHD